jgi:hypothetical protein
MGQYRGLGSEGRRIVTEKYKNQKIKQEKKTKCAVDHRTESLKSIKTYFWLSTISM